AGDRVERVDRLALRALVGAGDHLEIFAITVIDAGLARDLRDLPAEDELHQVDLVRAEILDDAAQALLGGEPEVAAAAAAPVLEELRGSLEVGRLPQNGAALHEPARLEDAGRSLVAERDHRRRPGLLRRGRHVLRLFE